MSVVRAARPAPGGRAGDEPLGVLGLPGEIAAYRAPALPEPAVFAAHPGALAVLRAVQRALAERLAGEVPAPIDLGALERAELALVDRLLGEGEVVAQVMPRGGWGRRSEGDGGEVGSEVGLQAQESVFAGVWRVRHLQGGMVARDTIEVGPVPQGLIDAARIDALTAPGADGAPPPGLTNGPAVLAELRDRARTWRRGDPAQVINLTLLPLTDGDSAYLDAQLGAGRVLILSRGYGTCRIVDTRLQRTWRVTYCNASDIVVLDTLELALVPEVACAAPQDLEDAAERIGELLAWAEGP
jgi:hydrogenase-1 operon protein HyaF